MGLDGQKPDGRGAWMPLKPGHGRNFKSDGSKHTYSDRFGLELTLAHTLKKHHPDAHIAFIKYSRGGTAIDSKAEAQKRFGAWDPEWNGGFTIAMPADAGRSVVVTHSMHVEQVSESQRKYISDPIPTHSWYGFNVHATKRSVAPRPYSLLTLPAGAMLQWTHKYDFRWRNDF